MRDRLPKFPKSSRLCRHIEDEDRARNGRVSPSAFRRRPSESYLSVNSTEIETVKQIAAYYAAHRQGGRRPVLISDPKVSDYNNAAAQAGVSLSFDSSNGAWVFSASGAKKAAYALHRNANSPSHCGVEFVSIFDEFQDYKFAGHISSGRMCKVIK